MTTTTYIAFRSSDHLHQLTDGFIKRMRDGAHKPEPAVVEEIMTTFIAESLEAFFLKPAALAGLSGTQRKLVQVAADTISRATRLVIGRSARKMDLVQNRAAAEYMDEIRLPSADHSYWYVVFPVSEQVAAQGRELADLQAASKDKHAHQAMITYLRAITDQALIWYFNKPIELLRFGPILRKVAAVGVDTTRRASYGVINKVIPKLGDEQFHQSALYYKSMQLNR